MIQINDTYPIIKIGDRFQRSETIYNKLLYNIDTNLLCAYVQLGIIIYVIAPYMYFVYAAVRASIPASRKEGNAHYIRHM